MIGDLDGTTTELTLVAILTILPQANNATQPITRLSRSMTVTAQLLPVSGESVTGPMLVQHDIKPVVTAVNWSSTFLHTALPIANTVFVACYGLSSVSDFANPASRYGLPVTVIGGVESDPDHYTRFEEFMVALTAMC